MVPEGTRYNHRDLSWLGFNYRVLQEAMDPIVPLIERLRFLAIYSSNLDEYFRVRVAGLQTLVRLGKKTKKQMGFNPKELLKEIRREVNQQQELFSKIFFEDILVQLEGEGIVLMPIERLDAKQVDYISDFFKTHMMPFVQPVLLDDHKVMPFLNNAALYLFVHLRDKQSWVDRYAIVKIPSDHIPRFIQLPRQKQAHMLVMLDDAVRLTIPQLFPGFDIKGSYSIKLTRDAELYIEDEFDGDLVSKIKKSLRKRNVGPASRLVYDRSMPEHLLLYLSSLFGLKKIDLLPEGRYHNNFDFFNFPHFNKSKLLYHPLAPLPFYPLERGDIFDKIAQKDYLINPPYHRYNAVVNFFEVAADDPLVTEIKIVQYRVAKKSKIMNALMRAVKNGKRVSAFVEIKARFDEEANLQWGERLEKAGVKVSYSFPGLKVHSKTALVVRKEAKGERMYCYLSTGNFHETTAKVYTDFGLFTAEPAITAETRRVFDFLETSKLPDIPFKHLLVGQFNIRPQLEKLVQAEMDRAQIGEQAEIFLKLNSIQDVQKIDLLYKASKAGVKIRVIVRGICCLIPGVKDLSENIEAISIVDRYLEHARVFVFFNGGNPLVYLSSADWMERNLSRRVEVVFPIYQDDIKNTILDVMEMQWRDNVKARYMDKKRYNNYKRNSKTMFQSQLETYNYYKSKQTELKEEC